MLSAPLAGPSGLSARDLALVRALGPGYHCGQCHLLPSIHGNTVGRERLAGGTQTQTLVPAPGVAIRCPPQHTSECPAFSQSRHPLTLVPGSLGHFHSAKCPTTGWEGETLRSWARPPPPPPTPTTSHVLASPEQDPRLGLAATVKAKLPSLRPPMVTHSWGEEPPAGDHVCIPSPNPLGRTKRPAQPRASCLEGTEAGQHRIGGRQHIRTEPHCGTWLWRGSGWPRTHISALGFPKRLFPGEGGTTPTRRVLSTARNTTGSRHA